jgi:hypothetical protein
MRRTILKTQLVVFMRRLPNHALILARFAGGWIRHCQCNDNKNSGFLPVN